VRHIRRPLRDALVFRSRIPATLWLANIHCRFATRRKATAHDIAILNHQPTLHRKPYRPAKNLIGVGTARPHFHFLLSFLGSFSIGFRVENRIILLIDSRLQILRLGVRLVIFHFGPLAKC
jgi:hypothetical protein